MTKSELIEAIAEADNDAEVEARSVYGEDIVLSEITVENGKICIEVEEY